MFSFKIDLVLIFFYAHVKMKGKVNKSLYADVEINTVIIKSENFGFHQGLGYEIQINGEPFIRQPGIAFKFISILIFISIISF